MTSNNADQANHKDSNKEKEKKHDSGEIIILYKGSNIDTFNVAPPGGRL